MPVSATGPNDVAAALRTAIAAQVADAEIDVQAHGGGHFSVVVKSAVFRGKSMLENHRLVYAAMAPLLAGPDAPVHAIDSLRTIGR
jgi:stress-induced morphogen